LAAKFIPGLNAVAAPLAGDAGVGLLRFLAFDTLGVVIWSGAYIGVGYIFSNQLELALMYVERLGSGAVILVAVLAAAWILWKFVQRRRYLNRLEVARISAQELLDRMDAGEDLYIVDLRSSLQDDSNSVPGAIRLS